MQKLLWPERLFDGWGMDRLDAMQVLLAVVDEGSLSAGARKLRIPVATLTRNVNDLETLVGSKLLVRTTRRLEQAVQALAIQCATAPLRP